MSKRVKWSEALLNNVVRKAAPAATAEFLARVQYRPFLELDYYAEPTFSDRLTRNHFALFGERLIQRSRCLAVSAPGKATTFRLLATHQVCDWHFMGDTQLYGQYRFASNGERQDNITDWAMKHFQQHYHPGKGRKPAAINKGAIFHYVYAVLHDPLYREKYGQNLKREFPRIPLYGNTVAHFEQWATWGRELMDLHIDYETVEPWPVKRSDQPDTKARAAGQSPKCILKSLPDEGRIVLDSETSLSGIPAEAWAYKLGNRSALDWVLDQHKERKPKDPTIREKFDTYRFADHKERVATLLARVARVSVETVRLVAELKGGPR
jgi:predicted helicase